MIIQQTWQDLKDKHPDSIVLLRVGDFYEAFNDDAETVSDTCGVVLCSRKFGSTRWEMAGFPTFAGDAHIRALREAGYRVVVAEKVQHYIDRILNRMEEA